MHNLIHASFRYFLGVSRTGSASDWCNIVSEWRYINLPLIQYNKIMIQSHRHSCLHSHNYNKVW